MCHYPHYADRAFTVSKRQSPSGPGGALGITLFRAPCAQGRMEAPSVEMSKDRIAEPEVIATALAEERGTRRELLSERLLVLLDDMLAGQAPNAGRFCGYCYHPLSPERDTCAHCGHSTADRPTVAAVPRPVIEMHRRRRGREGLVVRAIAWGGLTVGVIVALLPLAFANVSWLSVLAFFGLLAFFYLLSANLANSLGDSLGYRWGQSLVRREWARFIRQRDVQTAKEEPLNRRT
jgi:hypothetical protein